MKAAEFLDYVLGDFGVEHDPTDRLLTFKLFQNWLLKRHKLGQSSVLIVDEAQNLSPEAFEVVHALSNMETPTEKLLQIVLSGQREVEALLRLPELKSVSQRIADRLRTCPLSPEETLHYIAHRIQVAGGDIKTIFTPGAIKAVAWSSAGIPRLINLICEHALISGYADQRRPVGAETVQVVAREFSLPVANLSAEDLAEGVQIPPQVGALTPPMTATTSPASLPPPPVTDQVSAQAQEVAISTAAPAGNSAATTPTPQGRGNDKPAATRKQAPKLIKPKGSKFISPTMKEPGSEGLAAAPSTPVMPGVAVPVPTPSNLEFTGAQATGGPAPTGIPSGNPLITVNPPAKEESIVEDANLASWKTPQPLPLKKVAAGRGFAHTKNDSPQPASERPGALRWSALVLILMGLALGGYSLVASGLLTKIHWGQPLKAGIQTPIPEKSTGANPPDTHQPGPAVGPAAPGQAQASTLPPTSLPAGNPGQITMPPVNSARGEPPSDSHPTSLRSAESQGPPKPGTHEPAAPLPPPAEGQIAVMANVPGATISVDGNTDPDWTTPHMIKELSPGAHRVVVSKPGYSDLQQTVTVEAGKVTTFNATLTTPQGEIDIATNPPGAEVLVDGKSYGPSPVRAAVVAGQHTFLVKHAGRLPVEGKLAVQDQAVVQRSINLPPKPSTTPELNITVTANPPAATIYADGAPKAGSTPASFHLLPGHHILIISAAGFRPARREIDVPEDGTLTVNVELTAQ
jgi:hypothetical protein